MKGTFFPLHPDSKRMYDPHRVRDEAPVLLDPTDADDPVLLWFLVDGRAVAAPHVTDEWEKHRVQYSVERYNLDFHALVEKRRGRLG